MKAEPQRITLSLISHTNAGKTTLARTLLQQDIGEVRDAPHVTEFVEAHRLVRSETGDELVLWDTPGFGDSVRLLNRVQRDGTALGWFLTAVWDRWQDRPFWASQQALRHVRDQTDVVLYLVNAAEAPEAAPHVDAEMRLLGWMGRPVVVVLNQLGVDHDAARDRADLERWRMHLARHPGVGALLPLDAFARCWVQEGVLWQAIAQALKSPQSDAMLRLAQAWWLPRHQCFVAASQVLADSLADMALLRVPLEGQGSLAQAWRGLAGGVARRALAKWEPANAETRSEDRDDQQAQRQLIQAVEQRLDSELSAMLGLHALQADAETRAAITLRVDGLLDLHTRLNERKSAAWGGVITGALAGLKADVASGGLTLGGGMLVGGVLGALAGMGVAKGLNTVRGGGVPWAGLSTAALDALVEAALLRYLAVAHFGRGRGSWQHDPVPQHWLATVRATLELQRAAWAAAWDARPRAGPAPGTAAERERLARALQPLLAASMRDTLLRLYPEAAAQWAS
jgi:hypothetical protein